MDKKNLPCNLVIDFDSTFVKLEALEQLARIVLENDPQKEQISNEIERITSLGMNGKITFSQSLARRLSLFSPEEKDIRELVNLLKRNISSSVLHNKDFFKDNSKKIYIITGGFEDFAWPVVGDFGIEKDHLLANKFVFDAKGKISEIDHGRALCKDRGKVKAVRELDLQGKTIVIGDGWTDFEIVGQGVADEFWAFCENVERKPVVERAKHVVKNFDQAIKLLKSK